MDNSTGIGEERLEHRALQQEERKGEAVRDGFMYDIGDLLEVQPPTLGISPAGRPDTMYRDHLRVVFRFWDGDTNVYVVETEDGIGTFLMEKDARLQLRAPGPGRQPGREEGRAGETDWKALRASMVTGFVMASLERDGIPPSSWQRGGIVDTAFEMADGIERRLREREDDDERD